MIEVKHWGNGNIKSVECKNATIARLRAGMIEIGGNVLKTTTGDKGAHCSFL